MRRLDPSCFPACLVWLLPCLTTEGYAHYYLTGRCRRRTARNKYPLNSCWPQIIPTTALYFAHPPNGQNAATETSQ